VARTEIPRSEWHRFCETFTRNHRGWRVTIALIDTALLESMPEARAHPLTRELPFHGITEESPEHDRAMVVTAGDGPHHLTHTIRDGQHLFLERRANGADVGLRIDARSGQSTLLRFRTAARPEALDGLTPGER